MGKNQEECSKKHEVKIFSSFIKNPIHHSNDLTALWKIAETHYLRKEYEEACGYLEEIYRKDPHNQLALTRLFYSLVALRKYPRIAQILNIAIERGGSIGKIASELKEDIYKL